MQSKFCKNKVCRKCARCCSSFSPGLQLDKDVDMSVRRQLYLKSGIIYPHPILNRLNLSPGEADMMKQEAAKRGIKIKIIPNKVLYDSEHDKAIVIDYVLDHDVCPFLKNNLCSIYEKRPENCRKFPEISSNLDDINEKVAGTGLKPSADFDFALERVNGLLGS